MQCQSHEYPGSQLYRPAILGSFCQYALARGNGTLDPLATSDHTATIARGHGTVGLADPDRFTISRSDDQSLVGLWSSALVALDIAATPTAQ